MISGDSLNLHSPSMPILVRQPTPTTALRGFEMRTAVALVGDQCGSLQAEIGQLREDLRKKADELESLTLERDQLKAEALNGKSKTTALKIIGGMAIDAYRVDIHSNRMNNISEIDQALQTLGANVNAKTLREWLTDAAKVVDPRR